MKKFLILSMLFCYSLSLHAQFEGSKQIFAIPDLKEVISSHKKIAIIPLNTSIQYYKMPKNLESVIGDEEKKLGLALQSHLYSNLLRNSTNFSIYIQDIERTNNLLKKAGIDEKGSQLNPEELCKILQVDAIIIANYNWNKLRSESAAIARTLLFGMGGGIASGSITIQIHEAKEGRMLWRFNRDIVEGVFSSEHGIKRKMMRQIARNFPYRQKNISFH